MMVLGICSSPHREGNTAYALGHCLERIESAGISTTSISIAEKNIHNCDGCFKCRDANRCVYDDDMTAIYQKLRECDGLVLASPVYLGLVNGPMKTMMASARPTAIAMKSPTTCSLNSI